MVSKTSKHPLNKFLEEVGLTENAFMVAMQVHAPEFTHIHRASVVREPKPQERADLRLSEHIPARVFKWLGKPYSVALVDRHTLRVEPFPAVDADQSAHGSAFAPALATVPESPSKTSHKR